MFFLLGQFQGFATSTLLYLRWDDSLGAVLCILGCLAVSLASTHLMPKCHYYLPHKIVITKVAPESVKCHDRVGESCPVENHWPIEIKSPSIFTDMHVRVIKHQYDATVNPFLNQTIYYFLLQY
jgi:hypothetical protein